MMSLTFCLDVGNDWYFILCNFGGFTMRSFEEREKGSSLRKENKSPVLRINALSF